MITVCLTSCNRFDLLERTLDSFLALNIYPIEKYIINEDSGSKEVIKRIIDKYGDLVHIIRSPKNEGLLKSIDNMYSLVDTPYIFGLEDDWEFSGNANFMQESLDILENNKNIHQVWIRRNISNDWIEPQSFGTYKMIKSPHLGGWSGFTFNPSLKRTEDYKIFFPNGMNKFNHIGNPGISELNCNNHVFPLGYRAAILTNSACDHIGEGKSVTEHLHQK